MQRINRYIAGFFAFLALAAAAPTSVTAAEKTNCALPQVSARVDFRKEEIAYDLGIRFAIHNKVRNRVWSTYEVKRKLFIEPQLEGQCLRSLDILVDASPVIHLTKDSTDPVKYGCGRQTSLDREKRYAPIARSRYGQLPEIIKSKVTEILDDNPEAPHKAALQQITKELDDNGPLISQFQKDFDKEREAFSAAERANSANIERKCRLQTQKQDTRLQRTPRKKRNNRHVLKCETLSPQNSASGAGFHSRREATRQRCRKE